MGCAAEGEAAVFESSAPSVSGVWRPGPLKAIERPGGAVLSPVVFCVLWMSCVHFHADAPQYLRLYFLRVRYTFCMFAQSPIGWRHTRHATSQPHRNNERSRPRHDIAFRLRLGLPFCVHRCQVTSGSARAHTVTHTPCFSGGGGPGRRPPYRPFVQCLSHQRVLISEAGGGEDLVVSVAKDRGEVLLALLDLAQSLVVRLAQPLDHGRDSAYGVVATVG